MRDYRSMNSFIYNEINDIYFTHADYDYEDDNYVDLMSTQDMVTKLNLLVDNKLAICIKGSASTYTELDTGHPNISSKFIIKYNPKFNKYRENAYEKLVEVQNRVDIPEELIGLENSTLSDGIYFVKPRKKDDTYLVLHILTEVDRWYSDKHSSLYIVGPKRNKYKKKYFKLVDYYKNIYEKNQPDYIYDRSSNEHCSKIKFKPFDQMVFDHKEDILEYIDHFINNIPGYYEYGITPKLSILLYGDVGTGKTTFFQALAKYLNLHDIQCVKPNYFRNMIQKEGGRAPARQTLFKTMLAIDEIDCIANSRENDDSLENKEVIQQLLAFLDNPPTFYFKAKDDKYYPISIIVATTNYYDKLDKAIIRPGRFDLHIEMNNFTLEQGEEFTKLYGLSLEDVLDDDTYTKASKSPKERLISPANLQALCMRKIDSGFKGSYNNKKHKKKKKKKRIKD